MSEREQQRWPSRPDLVPGTGALCRTCGQPAELWYVTGDPDDPDGAVCDEHAEPQPGWYLVGGAWLVSAPGPGADWFDPRERYPLVYAAVALLAEQRRAALAARGGSLPDDRAAMVDEVATAATRQLQAAVHIVGAVPGQRPAGGQQRSAKGTATA